MHPKKVLFATLFLALPIILHAAEPEAPKENKPNHKRENLDGVNIQEMEEKQFWERRKKAVEKQRAEEAAAALKAKETPKPEASTPPKETKPDTPPTK